MTDPRYMHSGLDFAVGKAVEEAGEFLAAAGKTLRWGWFSVNPDLTPEKQETNISWVMRELEDLRAALNNLEYEIENKYGPCATQDTEVERALVRQQSG